jgi:hypothetical protein
MSTPFSHPLWHFHLNATFAVHRDKEMIPEQVTSSGVNHKFTVQRGDQ